MTTELEKQFFDTFGIEPKTELHFMCVYDNRPRIRNCQKPKSECENCSDFLKQTIYPQITNKRYIELYCVLCDVFNLFDVHRYPVITFRTKDFKENVLKELIQTNKYYKQEYIKNQIQKIFSNQ